MRKSEQESKINDEKGDQKPKTYNVEPGSSKALLMSYGMAWKMIREREAKNKAWVSEYSNTSADLPKQD